MELERRDRQVSWHPFTQAQTAPPAIPITHASGALLFAEDGRRYIDAVSSWWVTLHGHAQQHIAEAIHRQALKLEHVMFAGFTHEPAIELAERLLPLIPGRPSRLFYSDNGSTSVEIAIKMALQFWVNQGRPRRRIFALEDSYHGDTFGAMSAGARGPFTEPFTPHLFEVTHLPRPTAENIDAIVESFDRELAGGDVAAFIFEPLLQAAGGMRMYEAPHLDRLLDRCRAHDVVTIADEVMTGFGRTGPIFASERLIIPPDLVCMSKGLTGGALPLGATSAGERIYDGFRHPERLKMFLHGHSFTANPIACAAALASLDLLEKPECGERRERIASRHADTARRLGKLPLVRSVRQLGTVLAFDLVTEDQAGYRNPSALRVMQQSLSRGVVLRPLGEVVYTIPPYCISDSELDEVYETLVWMASRSD